ncbi:MAG TPA: hypothetical protein VD978_05025 [Azospirillum sp.]|nr:hypothetical protein [Azospirillum sp.]
MRKLFAAAVVGGVALTSAASAQTITASKVDQNFLSLLAEAKTKTPALGDSATINTSLAIAEWYWAKDARRKAQEYLNFARGKLGLSLLPADVTVVERVSEHSTSVR